MSYIRSSNAHPDYDDLAFEIAGDGTILKSHLTPEWTEGIPQRFDTAEFLQAYGKLDDSIDILDIGYWDETGEYEPPESDFREMVAEEFGMRRIDTAESEAEPNFVVYHGQNRVRR